MPIYEYTCRKCGAHLEVMQKVTDEPLKRHGKCGGKLEKEWSQTSFQLKGSGWYVTDYAKKSDSKESKEAKPEAQAGKPKAEETPKAEEKSKGGETAKTEEKPKGKSPASGAATTKSSD